MANNLTTGSNNLSDLTGFFNGFNKDTAVKKELSEQTNEKLVSIGKSFKTDAKLQRRLVKLSKFDMGMDIAAYAQDRKSKELLVAKQDRDTVDSAMDAKIEEHGSVNNDLLSRIEIVLVTRLDRILDGIKLMLPKDKGSFKGSKFGPEDFGEAVKKSMDINNTFLKKSIANLRYERYNRKNEREKEKIAALRRRGKTADADKAEKIRKEKELRLEGFNPDGSLLRKKARLYFNWKKDNQDRKDVGPTEYRGNLTGKMGTSSSIMGTRSSKMGTRSSKMGKMGKLGKLGKLGRMRRMGLKLLNFTKTISKLFLKGGYIGILIYSIAPLLESLKSDEMVAKWDAVKGSFLKNWEKLKDSTEKLWIKVEPFVTAINNFMIEIGKTVGGWLGESIKTILDTFVDIFDGLGMLFEGDIAGALKTILIGKDSRGGIINMLGKIVLDAVESVWTLIKKWVGDFDIGSEISRMLIALKPAKGSWLDNILSGGEGEKLFPEKPARKVEPTETGSTVLDSSRRQLDAVEDAKKKTDNEAVGYNEVNYNKQGDVYNTLQYSTSQPRYTGDNDIIYGDTT